MKPEFNLDSIDETTEYTPSEGEAFMNPAQKQYFKKKLLSWKESILKNRERRGPSESNTEADVIDVASKETDQSIELASRRRENLLIDKIQTALQKINEGSYGYCEETGEPIDIKRLIVRPIANLSLEAQEKKEKLSKFRQNQSLF